MGKKLHAFCAFCRRSDMATLKCQQNLRQVLKALFIAIAFVFLYFGSASSLEILHGGVTLHGTESNFTFAKSIWTNNASYDNTFNGNNSVNYLLIDDVSISGTLQIISPLSQSGAQIALYRLDGSSNSYTSVLLKTWSGESIIGQYYIDQPGEYLVEASFPDETYPHITFDFFPDNDTGSCINLAPESGLACDESWLPAHYRREIEPWIRSQIDEIKYRIQSGDIETAKKIADFSFFIATSAMDAVDSAAHPTDIIDDKVRKLIFLSLKQDAGEEYEAWVETADLVVDHAIAFAKVYSGSPDAMWDVAQLMVSDVSSIANNASGIYAIDVLEEKFNETKIAWIMLETYIRDNYGDWDSLAVRAGLDPAYNPTIYEIIDGIAASLGYENHFYDTAYDLIKVEELFVEGAMNFGSWVMVRKTMDNPFDDVDGDGILNREDPDPNDSSIPGASDPNREPIAKIVASSDSVTINTTVTLDGSSSYDPDGDSIGGSHSWKLVSPAGSSSELSVTTGNSVSFTPDQEGSYTVTLSVSDGELMGTASKTISATKVYSEPELVELQEGRFAYTNIDLHACELKQIATLTVPSGEIWKEVTFATSRGIDVVLLVDDDEMPSKDSPVNSQTGELMDCDHGYAQRFDSDEEYDLYDQGGFPDWTKDLYAGDKLRLAVFSYDGISNYQFIVDITIDKDADGDEVPDDKDAFPNDPAEQYDSDGDGVGDNADKFDNDPAASIDSDDDGYPDSWNSGKAEADSTTGLTLDLFSDDSTEWADNDEDGVGDNADQFDDDSAASVDSDKDGYPDAWNSGKDADDSETGLVLDKFINDEVAAIDDDGDGHPDRWNPGKTAFDSTTGLTLDLFPDDITEWADSDFDGVGDNSDWASDDFNEWADTDGDGVGDNSDAAPNDPARSTNAAPIIEAIVDQIVTAGETKQITIVVSDDDGDEISLELITSPEFVVLNDRNLTIAPSLSEGGDYKILIRADDIYGGKSYSAFDLSITNSIQQIYLDEVSTSQDWQTLPLPNQYVQPVVIAGPPADHEVEPGVVRLRNVSGSGFEIRFQEWDYLDGNHANENLPYFILESGRHAMVDGSIWEAGTFALDGTGEWSSQSFTQPFAGIPRVFLTIQTYNGTEAVTVRAKNVNANGFDAALYEQEALMDGHAIETIGYLAVYSPTNSGTIAIDGADTGYSLQNEQLNNNWAQIGTAAFRLEEEQSQDTETAHTAETVHVLTIDGHVFAQIMSFNGGDSVALRQSMLDTDGDGLVDVLDLDDDNDGLPDSWELANGLDPLDSSDALKDTDSDGLNNLAEYNSGTDPDVYDTDGDGMPDGVDSHPNADAYRGVEQGVATVTQEWGNVVLPTLFDAPVVIAGPPTYHGSDPGVVRICNVSSDSFEAKFELRFQEWEYKDGSHIAEDIPHLVLEEGVHQLLDGSIAEVGKIELTGTRAWKSINFQSSFANQPKLFLTLQTYNGGQAVTVRATNVTVSGFEAALFEEEALNDGHIQETVGYLAIYSPTGSGRMDIGGDSWPYLLQTEEVDQRFVPVLSSALKLEEEQSMDTEISHIDETVDILALGDMLFAQDISAVGGDTVALRRIAPEYSAPMEWGTVNGVTDQWVTVPLAKLYSNPVVVAKLAEQAGGDPGVLRVRNVTADSFQVRFQEWNYLDGRHAEGERIFYLVSEAGTASVAGLQVQAGRVSTADSASWVDLTAFSGEAPALFAGVMTCNGGDTVTTRVNALSDVGFEVSLQEQESKTDGHVAETVGWIAIQKGLGRTGDGHKVEVSSWSTTDKARMITFAQAKARRFPVIVGNISSTEGGDPCVLRAQNLAADGVELLIEEEQSLDTETAHIAEDVSLFVAE